MRDDEGSDFFSFFSLDQGAVKISTEVEPWLRSWCKNILVKMSASDSFKNRVTTLSEKQI